MKTYLVKFKYPTEIMVEFIEAQNITQAIKIWSKSRKCRTIRIIEIKEV